jgi:hypothetical protein
MSSPLDQPDQPITAMSTDGPRIAESAAHFNGRCTHYLGDINPP